MNGSRLLFSLAVFVLVLGALGVKVGTMIQNFLGAIGGF